MFVKINFAYFYFANEVGIIIDVSSEIFAFAYFCVIYGRIITVKGKFSYTFIALGNILRLLDSCSNSLKFVNTSCIFIQFFFVAHIFDFFDIFGFSLHNTHFFKSYLKWCAQPIYVASENYVANNTHIYAHAFMHTHRQPAFTPTVQSHTHARMHCYSRHKET